MSKWTELLSVVVCVSWLNELFSVFIYLQMKKLARRQQQQQEQHSSQRLGQGEDLSSVCVDCAG